MLRRRLQGATLPDSLIDVVDDERLPITDGLNYSWIAEASRYPLPTTFIAPLFVKTSGFTSLATGVLVGWTGADIGLLAAVSGRDTTYVIEFTGTHVNGKILKHQETVVIGQQVG